MNHTTVLRVLYCTPTCTSRKPAPPFPGRLEAPVTTFLSRKKEGKKNLPSCHGWERTTYAPLMEDARLFLLYLRHGKKDHEGRFRPNDFRSKVNNHRNGGKCLPVAGVGDWIAGWIWNTLCGSNKLWGYICFREYLLKSILCPKIVIVCSTPPISVI